MQIFKQVEVKHNFNSIWTIYMYLKVDLKQTIPPLIVRQSLVCASLVEQSVKVKDVTLIIWTNNPFYLFLYF